MSDPSRFAINQATFGRQWSLPDCVDALARANIRGIAIWPDRLAECGLPAATDALRRTAMTVTGYCCGDLFDAGTERAAQARARQRVDEAAALGARCLVAVVGGPVPRGAIDDVRRRAEDNLAGLLPYARASGVPIAIEPIHPMRATDLCCVNTLAQANALCSRLGEGTGVVVDTYHVWWDPDLATSVAAARGRILAFHLADWLAETTTLVAGRGMLGDGVIDLAGIAALVEAAGYTGFHEVEVLSAADWAQRPPAEVLETCIARLRQFGQALAAFSPPPAAVQAPATASR